MMLLLAPLLLPRSCWAAIPAGDPYPPLHGGSFSAKKVAASPDPAQSYVWDLDKLTEPAAYQSISDRPVEVSLQSGAAADFQNLASLTAEAPATARISGAGLISLKFAQEGACWVEFTSSDLAASGATVSLTVSENKLPAPLETHAPVQHGDAWRLEPNPQLYEGIRYAFLNVSAAPPDAHGQQQQQPAAIKPFTITQFRRGCQVVPTNYNGHFESSDPDIDRIWWVGAYTVRVTLCGVGLGGGDRNQAPGVFLGSELMDRGDRIAFLGDAHVAQATALAAFGNYKVLASSNNYTKDIPNGIEPYWVMWVLSCLDYWDATADKAAMGLLTPWIIQRLEHARVLYAQAVNSSAALRWSRDDDRMGFGFEFSDIPEAQRAFRALTIEACSRFGAAMKTLGNATAAAEYTGAAASYVKELRADPEWYKAWGMHATGDAINAGFMTHAETTAAVANAMSDPLQLPSLSNFESYFVLKALATANESALAMGLVRRHWSYVTELKATTTWERFDPQHLESGAMSVDSPPVNVMNDRTSMAHPWGSGATAFLSSAGLGIAPTSAGYGTWDATPQLMGERSTDMLRAVKGTVPTPSGGIAIDIDLDAGLCTVTAPPETVGRLGLPKLAEGLETVELLEAPGMAALDETPLLLLANGSSQIPLTDAEMTAELGLSTGSDGRFWLVSGLRDGVYRFRFSHAAPLTAVAPAPAPPKFDYAAELVGMDLTTKGDWVGKYGKSGYYLFNASAEATDVSKLPAWIRNVWAPTTEDTKDTVTQGESPPLGNAREECPRPFSPDLNLEEDESGLGAAVGTGILSANKACVWVWNGTSPDDPRTPLAPGSQPGGQRVQAAAVSSRSWGGSFHLDVQAADGTATTRQNITLYVVDYERWGATQVVKAMDLATLKTVAPMAHVTPAAFDGGAYITYSYSGGMRFRLEQVHDRTSDRKGFPPRSMVTAVFFD